MSLRDGAGLWTAALPTVYVLSAVEPPGSQALSHLNCVPISRTPRPSQRGTESSTEGACSTCQPAGKLWGAAHRQADGGDLGWGDLAAVGGA